MAASGAAIKGVECPCQQYATIREIKHALSSEETAEKLIHWISGQIDESAASQNRSLACSSLSRCPQRVRASVDILNAIRDVCQLFMEKPVNGPSETTNKFTEPQSYEAAFPSLPAKSQPPGNNGTMRKATPVGPSKSQRNPVPVATKPKRRLQLAPAALPVVASPKDVATTKATSGGFHHGNISCLPSEEPLSLVNQVKEMLSHSQQTTVTKESIVAKASTASIPTPSASTIESIPNTNNATVSAAQETETTRQQVVRLARIYTTLIRCLLVPSTSMELIVLFEMLSVSETKTILLNTQRVNDIVFASIFPTPNCCRLFATTSFNELSSLLRNLSWPILDAIIRCPPFRQSLPELTKDLTDLVEEDRNVWSSPNLTGKGETPTALLTVPFDHHRDSRNNYKTRDASVLFQNREESRDSFLYQLRSFLSIRGKVLDVVQSGKRLENVRAESRRVLDGVMGANMAWFAQLFCDLLLQIGLVPMEETDKELLKIADRDTLQKLHRRFSSKDSNPSGNSRKPVVLKSIDTGNSPSDEAQLLFTGYQEFFFMFIMSTNCYTFNVHLRRRMSGMLVDMTARTLAPHDVESHILQSQLLAKFLGLLVFSPNWQLAGVDQLPSSSLPGSQDVVDEFVGMGLDLQAVVASAWRRRQLITAIPWIVALLQMAKWDSSFARSIKTNRLLSWLRSVQRAIEQSGTPRPRNSNLRLVSFFLETYFGSVVGLNFSIQLPLVPVPLVTADDAERLASMDEFSLTLGNMVVFSSSPPLEELMILINDLSRDKTSGPAGVTKKVKPLGISQHVRDPQESGNFDGGASLRYGSGHDMTWKTDKTSRIQSQLADAFFHQHKELKEVCFLVANKILANLNSELTEIAIQELHATPISQEVTKFEAIIEELISKYISSMQASLSEKVRQSLDLLAPCGTPNEVLDMATSLAVSNAMRTGETNLRLRLSSELKKIFSTRGKSVPKVTPGNEVPFSMESATKLLINLNDVLHSNGQSVLFDELETVAQEVVLFFETWGDAELDIPPEPILRSFYESLIALDNCIAAYLAASLLSAKNGWRSTSLLLKTATKISGRTKRGMNNISVFLSTEMNLLRLVEPAFEGIDFSSSVTADRISQAAFLVTELVAAKLVKVEGLEQIFSPLNRRDWRKPLCRECIQRLQSQSRFRHLLRGSTLTFFQGVLNSKD